MPCNTKKLKKPICKERNFRKKPRFANPQDHMYGMKFVIFLVRAAILYERGLHETKKPPGLNAGWLLVV